MSTPSNGEAGPVQFRGQRVEQQIAKRRRRDESKGSRAKEDLSRYYELLESCVPTLPLADACAFVDLHNSHWWTIPTDLSIIAANVQDASEAQLEKWGVERESLIGRLQSLSLSERMALVDATERFWRRAGEGRSTTALLVDVGLVSPAVLEDEDAS